MKKRKITDAVVVHCSATPEGRDHTAADIRRWHLARGFEDIGYHYIIRLDGTVEPGRDEALVGAHCPDGGMNARSVGVCYVGGMDAAMAQPRDTRTEPQRRALRQLVERLCGKYRIPRTRVFGHRDFARKACPSFDVRKGLWSVIVAIMMLPLGGCRSRTVLRTEYEAIHDTVRLVARCSEQIEVRDTFLLRERGDTVIKESIRWRIRNRVAGDTVVRVVRDTIATAVVPPQVPAAKSSRASAFTLLMRGVALGIGLCFLIRVLLYIRRNFFI